uniref:Uncharacterized protein n=1 Tax=Anguilla anguilla TaxID=7936 RepID=A0A0E9UY33_ANGAN
MFTGPASLLRKLSLGIYGGVLHSYRLCLNRERSMETLSQ